MSERDEYFNALVDGISGHLHPSKQLRINKRSLLLLLYESAETEFKGAKGLADAYFAKHGNGGDRTGLTSAVRSAVALLKSWFSDYYSAHQNLPIRFEIDDTFRLRAIVEDGFDTQGVEQLVKLTGTLLQQSVHDANRALHMFKGATPQNHADEFSALLDKLLAEVTKLRQVSAAARRRL